MDSAEILNRLVQVAEFGQTVSTHDRHKLGCYILGRGGFAWGANHLKTDPKVDSPFRYVHAEFDAIQRFFRKNGKLKKSILFVSRKRRDGILGSARPCSFCMQMIRMVGIKKVYWSEVGGYGEITFL